MNDMISIISIIFHIRKYVQLFLSLFFFASKDAAKFSDVCDMHLNEFTDSLTNEVKPIKSCTFSFAGFPCTDVSRKNPNSSTAAKLVSGTVWKCNALFVFL